MHTVEEREWVFPDCPTIVTDVSLISVKRVSSAMQSVRGSPILVTVHNAGGLLGGLNRTVLLPFLCRLHTAMLAIIV